MPQLITVSKNILSGTPVISGTRVPIGRIRFLIKKGYSVEDIQEEYPHIYSEKITNLIAYLMEMGENAYRAKIKTSR